MLDANLRDPTIHKIFNLKNDLGLTNLISEQTIDIQKYKKIINKNLSRHNKWAYRFRSY